MSEDKKYWFAIYTKPRWEKKVAKILDEKGIENYCPLRKVIKQWSDRKKTILEPVFKSYIFVKIEDERKWDLKKLNGVINFVYWVGKPATIRDEEIDTVKKFLNDFSDVSIEEMKFNVNDKVKITQGILMNYEGVIIELLGKKARIMIEGLGLIMSANIDKKNLSVMFPIAAK
ncbi:UpxY family transcription antiterminator [Ferruginibacter lapsinanis]|uniref:UpxY family transcription antiterminator n=1 Tax=Ferruginibacter lapsinanis TaxID=563172 RepID=UPI001E62EAA2|nr:UpxY family transcription antiterminator [Ferruginibacter lapsinanis]UEG49480.1 UpxY family transcription antiterminator [Ferruginibacter lapsinanis]